MKDERFITVIRFKKDKVLPYSAHITDKATGMKFASVFETKEHATVWIEKAKELLTKGRNF